MSTKHDVLFAQLVDAFDRTKRMHTFLYSVISRAKQFASDPTLSQEQRADVAYLLRRINELCDDLRKESDDAKGQHERTACIVWNALFEQDPHSAERSIRGQFVLATPHVRITARPPHPRREPEAYAALMKWCGLDMSNELASRGILRPNWNDLADLISEMTQAGRPLPPGIDPSKTSADYSLSMRENAGIDWTDEAKKAKEVLASQS